jgi:hypothetical protein
MKYIIVVDEMPETCDKCDFYQEGLEETDKKNVLNICKSCIWGAKSHDKCPLTVINTLFISE